MAHALRTTLAVVWFQSADEQRLVRDSCVKNALDIAQTEGIWINKEIAIAGEFWMSSLSLSLARPIALAVAYSYDRAYKSKHFS